MTGRTCENCTQWDPDACGLFGDAATCPRWEPADPLPLPDGVRDLMVHTPSGLWHEQCECEDWCRWIGYRVPVERAGEFAMGLR